MPACSTCGFESERPFRFCPECGAEQAAAAPSREQRKTVTVLFCDLTGSTALGETLDPERLRALLANYFERMKGEANADLAEVLLLAGRRDEAVAALEKAVESYERKGNLVSAQRARTRLAELQ